MIEGSGLMDPGGPKTCGSGGSWTLFKTKQKEINLINSLTKNQCCGPIFTESGCGYRSRLLGQSGSGPLSHGPHEVLSGNRRTSGHLKIWNLLTFFLYLVGQFCLPGSGSTTSTKSGSNPKTKNWENWKNWEVFCLGRLKVILLAKFPIIWQGCPNFFKIW